MPTDKTYLTLPDFRPQYDSNKEYSYKSPKAAHDNLNDLLEATSEKHCMYCYTNLKNDRGITEGHLEHAIEKEDEDSILAKCVPNIGLACSKCNISFKRIGEKNRKEYIEAERKQFESKKDCQKTKCKKMCSDYKELRDKYLSNDKAHIILQPQGVMGKDTGHDLRMQYNLATAEFEPSIDFGDYSKDERRFIMDHINQFALNDDGKRTQALFHFLEETINAEGKYLKKKEYYSNYIVDLFIEILETIVPKDRMKYCVDLYTNYLALHRIV
nr:hypothetical protein [uncultured Lachnoclostridium sp.]